MLATIASATLLGVVGTSVTVEVHVSSGLPGFTIVGLPDTSCREARDRVRAALLSSGLRWPQQRVTVNLAPTGVRKSGAGLDLAIAIGLLVADEQIPAEAAARRRVRRRARPRRRHPPGAAARCRSSTRCRPRSSWCRRPRRSRRSSWAVTSCGRRRRSTELLASLCGDDPWPALPSPLDLPPLPDPPDLSDVRGQDLARRALEVAAAGGHHLLMTGSPGSGKTMLAQRLVGLLPDLDLADGLETTRVHSAVGVALPPGGLVRRPPFRAPHHGASAVAIVGGGGRPAAARARSRSPTTACSSSTRWPSSTPTCSTRCASRSRRAPCAWREPGCGSRSRPASCWSAR